MNRATWFAAGAVSGVYALLKARSAARNLTPDGLAARAAALVAGLRVLTSEASVGMAAREAELREHLASTGPGLHVVVPALLERAPAGPGETTHRPRKEECLDGHR